jgi:hypothetical protein
MANFRGIGHRVSLNLEMPAEIEFLGTWHWGRRAKRERDTNNIDV